jgi:hypothetical protein
MTGRTLYCEASLCHTTGILGWGAVLAFELPNSPKYEIFAAEETDLAGEATLAELYGLQRAVRAFMRHGRFFKNEPITIVMRSTAALAVLRWVFPDAPFTGDVTVEKPKRLHRKVTSSDAIFQLHAYVEEFSIRLSLRHVFSDAHSAKAAEMARYAMERGRPGKPTR